ncbi:hypothetical protein BaRGS_00010777 [Batillaria attramentaria]|uniref:Uncharacterized protein n=1 Tax=Batillaria attramentaria TaxID=370345 RepID=A0ABD0LEL6_9CAEN
MATVEQETADLQQRIADLEAALAEQEQDTIKAAQFGKSLLEQNEDLKIRIDDLMKQHAAALEEKHQEVSSLQSRSEVQLCTERWQQEEITNLRTELQNLRQTVTDDLAEERRTEVHGYKKQVETLHMDLEHSQSLERELRGRISELESLLQSHLDRTQVHSTSASFDSEEMATMQQELMTAKMDITELQAKNIDLSGKLQQMQCERDTMTNRLAAASTEIEELQCQIMSYVSHLEQSRKESTELRAQLDAARVEGQGHSSKGNSLFSELEDRRLEVEKKMASLKVNNQQLKEKYEIEKQQNQKYKMQIAMALQMAGHKQDDAAVQRLRNQLNEAHAEIRALSEQMQKLEAAKSNTVEQLATSDLLANVEDKNYVQYLMTIIKSEKETAAKARSELQTKTLQYLDISNQNMELTRQTQSLRAECDKLQAALLKMTLQKEELQLKYEPEKVKGSSLQKRVVEKIDMGDSQLQSKGKLHPAPTTGRASDIFRLSSSSARTSDVFKVPATVGRPSEILKSSTAVSRASGVPKPPAASGRVSGVSKAQTKSSVHDNDYTLGLQDSVLCAGDDTTFYDDKENFCDSTMDSTFALLHGRKVSMSDNVKVVEADGEETVKTLTDEGDRAVKPEVAKKKKEPKTVRNVRHVNADEAPQVDCKQQ